MVSVPAYLGLVGAVACQRLLELRRARANAGWVLARGGREAGRGHYPAMVALHAAFLASAAIEGVWFPGRLPAAVVGLALFGVIAAQALRRWAMAALGPRWTTRVVASPGLPPVTSGPYRFVRHPNYVAVALELATLPLVRGAFLTAAAFSAADAALLAIRIPIEERALGQEWRRAFETVPRFLPGPRRG